jgi:YegS/Rv2252/BmrU family lipid kinase
MGAKSRRGGDTAAQVRETIARRGHLVLNEPGEQALWGANGLVRKYASSASAVVIGGGDGSVSAALPALTETKLPLCLLPLGTANNLARTNEIPRQIDAALDLLESGEIRTLDVGLANGIPFVNVAGLGLSTRINTLTPTRWKRWLGPLAFVVSAFRLARSFVPFRAEIACDGKPYRVKSLQVTICNGCHYGTGLRVAESASFDDGKLNCLSFAPERWWQILFYLPSLIRGRFQERHQVQSMEGEVITVRTPHPMRVDLDGDVKTKTPLEVEVIPGALRMYCPSRRERDRVGAA